MYASEEGFIDNTSRNAVLSCQLMNTTEEKFQNQAFDLCSEREAILYDFLC